MPKVADLSGLLRLSGSWLSVESEGLLVRRRAWARLNSFYVRMFPSVIHKASYKNSVEISPM